MCREQNKMKIDFSIILDPVRFLYFPYAAPMLRREYCGIYWSLFWRRMVYYICVSFFLAPGYFDNTPGQWVALPFCMGLFWLPYISLVCRRLQGAGFATPYMGWPFLGIVIGVLLLYRDQFPFPNELWHIFYVDALLLIPAFFSDNPVYGVGVFTAKSPPEPEWRRPFQTWK